MIGAIDNIRSTTAHAECHKVEFDLIHPGQGLFDVTVDGGRPRRDCHGAEWFWTGVVLTLAAVIITFLTFSS